MKVTLLARLLTMQFTGQLHNYTAYKQVCKSYYKTLIEMAMHA